MDFRNFNIDSRVVLEIGYAVIAMAGGVAQYLERYIREGNFRIGQFLAQVFVSGFSGWIFAHFCANLGLPNDLSVALSGIGGFFGVNALNYLYERVTNSKAKSDDGAGLPG